MNRYRFPRISTAFEEKILKTKKLYSEFQRIIEQSEMLHCDFNQFYPTYYHTSPVRIHEENTLRVPRTKNRIYKSKFPLQQAFLK